MTQALLAVFGLTALLLAYAKSERARRWSPVVGLAGQPWWLWETWNAGQGGMFAVSAAYTGVFLFAIWRRA